MKRRWLDFLTGDELLVPSDEREFTTKDSCEMDTGLEVIRLFPFSRSWKNNKRLDSI